MAPRDDWATAATIDEVLERMDAIDGVLSSDDGVAMFTRMYRQVTRLVQEAAHQGRFCAGEFIERLDVRFANLFFEAVAADQDQRQIPAAWAPLFCSRARVSTHPIQFALAGMNAHITHDLPLAVVDTCRDLGVSPEDGSPEHQDFSTTNEVLELAQDQVKAWFSTGVVASIDRLGGEVDDGLASLGIAASRAVAWESAQVLWSLADNPRLHRLFLGSLTRSVEIANRGILL